MSLSQRKKLEEDLLNEVCLPLQESGFSPNVLECITDEVTLLLHLKVLTIIYHNLSFYSSVRASIFSSYSPPGPIMSFLTLFFVFSYRCLCFIFLKNVIERPNTLIHTNTIHHRWTISLMKRKWLTSAVAQWMIESFLFSAMRSLPWWDLLLRRESPWSSSSQQTQRNEMLELTIQ